MPKCYSLLLATGMLVALGCAKESAQDQAPIVEQTITLTSLSNETQVASRVFEAGETCRLSVKADVPRMIGFRTSINDSTRSMLRSKADASGKFEDNYTGEITQLPSGNAIGAMDGGCIEMTPVNGLINFEFKNYLNRSQHFEIYSTVSSN